MTDEGHDLLTAWLRAHGVTLGAFLEAWGEHVNARSGGVTSTTAIERRCIARAKEIDADRRKRS